MELKVTALVEAENMNRFSDSVFNSGLSNIGEITWNNAVAATEYHLLKTDEQLENARSWFEGFGAWDRNELDTMSTEEINALLLQFLAGDIQEMEGFETYEAYEKAAHDGTASGRVYRTEQVGGKREWFAYIGD